MFFHLGKFRFWGEFSFVSKFQHFELFHFGIFGFDTQCLSNMSPIALFYVMDFACVPLASFGYSFLVVVFCEGRGATLLGVDCSFSKTSKNPTKIPMIFGLITYYVSKCRVIPFWNFPVLYWMLLTSVVLFIHVKYVTYSTSSYNGFCLCQNVELFHFGIFRFYT